MKVEENKIHIGRIIKEIANKKGILDSKLSYILGCHPSNLINIYKRESIKTDLLWKISMALEYDFFTDIYGASLNLLLKNKMDYGTMNITVSGEKVSVEYNKGNIRTIEYRKHSEKIAKMN